MTREQDDLKQRGRLDARELHAWQAFFQMQQLLRGRIEHQLQECSGLSLADYTVLTVLSAAAGGRLRAYELAGMLEWEKSRLHHQLTRMSKRGLVERRCGEGRAINVEITEHGRAILEQAAPHHSAHVRGMVIDLLSPDQIDQLTAISTTILANLSETAPRTDAPQQ